ncbi:hypothetical protein DFH27DRAFT_147633 [Peziza echinospora]|nr:hypothetical protein DFH27DRAFT_69382 [Peziza echinospora]KAI5793899.1 hypothetical protein DFH27DRAFT_147633 [Peziza echinospora]
MATTTRMALRRLSCVSPAVSISARISRPCATRTSALKAYSTYTQNPLLQVNTRKASGLFGNTSSTFLQSRTYAIEVVKVPQMAESISEGTLKQWQKKVGDYVAADEEIATIETDKIDVAVNAPVAGTITEFLAQEEDTVNVGQEIVKIDTDGKAPEGGAAPAKEEPKAAAAPSQQTQQQSAPSSQTSSPAPSHAAPAQSTPAQSSSPAPSGHAQSPFGNRNEERVKMSRIRLRTAERLKQSQDTAASLTTFNEVDMSALMEMRALFNPELAEMAGLKMGFLGAFGKAVSLAIKQVPAVNSSIEGPNGGDTIVYRDYVDISIAVATEKGLLTPVVRNVESMDILDIEQSIAALGTKARDGKITMEDMAGGTFTISNGGVFGSLMGTPIINLPQTAVLGLHAIKERPIAVKGQVVIRPMMFLALTYDHRVLDGREAVTFLVKVKEYIEDPRKMLLPYIPLPPKPAEPKA